MPPSRKAVTWVAVLASTVGMGPGPIAAAQADTLTFRIQAPTRTLVRNIHAGPSCDADVWFWGAEGSTVSYSTASLIAPDGSGRPDSVRRVLPGEEGGFGVGCSPLLEDKGRWRIRVVAYDRNGKVLGSREEAWYEKLNTQIKDVGAAPEPVRKGRIVTVSGRLRRLTDRPWSYSAYPGKTVRIYFRAKGATTWTYMGSAKTGADGRFRKGFTARQDGTWRSEFPGAARFDRQNSSHDYVDVR